MPSVRIASAFVLIVSLALAANAQQSPAQTAAPKISVSTSSVATSAQVTNDSELSLAVCPIVYPVDQYSSDRGFHYIFYGNAFFINRDGYLLTAAHVLSQLNGAQPYIVVRRPMAPPQLVKATLVAQDTDHDVALMRAEPNPFDGKYQVKYLSIAVNRPALVQSVLAAALRPSRLKDPHTFDAFTEDRPVGPILSYEFSQLDKGSPDTQLLLFQHAVLKGDSGAPVVAAHGPPAAIGLVEGQWLRANSARTAASSGGIGAVIRIHYAVALLQREHITWHPADDPFLQVYPNTTVVSSLPRPLSLVNAYFPPQSLSGATVVFDAAIAPTGRLTDIQRIQGSSPFFENAQAAIDTWTFVPPDPAVKDTPARIAIIFEFGQTSTAIRSQLMKDPPSLRENQAAIPMPASTDAALPDKNAIIALKINNEGRATATNLLQGSPPLLDSIDADIRTRKFFPAYCAAASCESLAILVLVSRTNR